MSSVVPLFEALGALLPRGAAGRALSSTSRPPAGRAVAPRPSSPRRSPGMHEAHDLLVALMLAVAFGATLWLYGR